jgi:prefoldin subunit 5
MTTEQAKTRAAILRHGIEELDREIERINGRKREMQEQIDQLSKENAEWKS